MPKVMLEFVSLMIACDPAWIGMDLGARLA
jgi:hypothetical protein